VVLGVVAAVAATRLMSALLYETTAVEPVVFAAMSFLMIGVGILASYMPARRASRVHPIEAAAVHRPATVGQRHSPMRSSNRRHRGSWCSP
jgi:hypothetical protein